jgi:hypothetical protein
MRDLEGDDGEDGIGLDNRNVGEGVQPFVLAVNRLRADDRDGIAERRLGQRR